jgi:tetratricopeptide (TPR) repeat protein
VIFLALSLALLARPAAAISPEADRALLEGVDDIFRMEFDKAEEQAKLAIQLEPEHPAGRFLQAGIAWTRFVYETDQSDLGRLPIFEKSVQDVIDVGEKYLKAHPDDPLALTSVGASYGISSRLLVIRKEWLKAYWHGRKAIAITRKAVKADPGFYDAYLGMGMYDYYSDLYPRVVKILARLVLGGDRMRGIQTLRMVAEKGRFSASPAKILLVEIYSEDPFGAKDSHEAMRFTEELRAKYPGSAMMHGAQLASWYYAKRFHETAESAEEYVKLVDEGKYNPIEAAKGYVFLGTAQWALGRKSEALESFAKASVVKLDGRLSRWAVFALIRSGQLLDQLGRRDDALSAYHKAAAEPDTWSFRYLAKEGISKPFRSDDVGAIEPP